MYGTRPAVDVWQGEYSTALVRMGFAHGVVSPTVFRHAAREMSCSVHGDDFKSSGPAGALDWLEASIAAEHEIPVGPRLGPGPGSAKQVHALNRVIIWRRQDRVRGRPRASRTAHRCVWHNWRQLHAHPWCNAHVPGARGIRAPRTAPPHCFSGIRSSVELLVGRPDRSPVRVQ